MKLLNVGAGGNRPQGEHWTNLDNLYETLKPGTPERINLEAEPRYVNHNLLKDDDGLMPFGDRSFEGILCSHVIEHFDCHDAVRILNDCGRILKPGGLLIVSIPDAKYFLSVHPRDKPVNAVELFGEPIHDAWQPNFMSYALFHREHRQLLTRESLWCLLLQAGFGLKDLFDIPKVNNLVESMKSEDLSFAGVYAEIEKIMNRRKFSVEMCVIK